MGFGSILRTIAYVLRALLGVVSATNTVREAVQSDERFDEFTRESVSRAGDRVLRELREARESDPTGVFREVIEDAIADPDLPGIRRDDFIDEDGDGIDDRDQ